MCIFPTGDLLFIKIFGKSDSRNSQFVVIFEGSSTIDLTFLSKKIRVEDKNPLENDLLFTLNYNIFYVYFLLICVYQIIIKTEVCKILMI